MALKACVSYEHTEQYKNNVSYQPQTYTPSDTAKPSQCYRI